MSTLTAKLGSKVNKQETKQLVNNNNGNDNIIVES